jgi:hypothetical protein
MTAMTYNLSALAALFTLVTFATSATAGETLYATSKFVNPNLLTIDSATGSVLTSVSITGDEALFGGLTFSADGAHLYSIDGYNDSLSDRTFRIDPASGTGVVVGDTGFNWNFRCVDSDPISGTLYATRDNELFTIDTTTGAATSVGTITGSSVDQATALAIDSTGNAYMTDIGSVGLFSLDLSTGVLTHLGDLNSSTYFQDLAFDSAGTLWGVGMNGGGLYNIDIGAVTATLIHNSPTYGGIAFALTGTEPGSGYCFGDPGSGAACPCANDNDGSVPGSGCANGVYPSGAKLTATGIASISSDSLVLTTSGLEPNNSGLYFQANNDLSPGVIWGDGLRCAGGELKRLQVRFASGSGISATTIGISAKAGNVLAGDTKRYQCWYRTTVNPPCGLGVNDFNASNGYSISWLP